MSMKHWMAGCAAAAMLMAAAPAAGQDDGYGYRFNPDGDSGLPSFAGLRGSFALSGSVDTTVPTATPTSLRASYNVGGGGSVYIGTRMPLGFRVELEGLYRYLPFRSVSLGGATATAASGSAQVAAPMVNLFWDLPVPDYPFRPFVGAGVGGAYTDINVKDAANTYLTTRKWNFAYDFMAGAEIPLSQSSRFTAMYRWLHLNDMTFKCGVSGPATSSCRSDLVSQGVDIGLEMDM